MSSEGAAGEADEWRKVIAQSESAFGRRWKDRGEADDSLMGTVRLQAFQIISLGAVEPLADKGESSRVRQSLSAI